MIRDQEITEEGYEALLIDPPDKESVFLSPEPENQNSPLAPMIEIMNQEILYPPALPSSSDISAFMEPKQKSQDLQFEEEFERKFIELFALFTSNHFMIESSKKSETLTIFGKDLVYSANEFSRKTNDLLYNLNNDVNNLTTIGGNTEKLKHYFESL